MQHWFHSLGLTVWVHMCVCACMWVCVSLDVWVSNFVWVISFVSVILCVSMSVCEFGVRRVEELLRRGSPLPKEFDCLSVCIIGEGSFLAENLPPRFPSDFWKFKPAPAIFFQHFQGIHIEIKILVTGVHYQNFWNSLKFQRWKWKWVFHFL